MEFLIYSMATVSMIFVLAKPQWEKWAFGLLASAFGLSAVLYIIGSWGALLSYWNV